jgi:hypothetical protein
MEEIAAVQEAYGKLRDAIASWIRDRLRGEAWYYQPTPLSNPAAWIVPHLIAFEQAFVYDAIPDYPFPRGASPEVVERYKPGVDGFALGKARLMTVEEAMAGIARLRGISDGLFADIRSGSTRAGGVDRRKVIAVYQHNASHDTEHFGQLKYLSGTWDRLHP